jgi:ABC-type multidrug transport system fused ATPase/permease subunit
MNELNIHNLLITFIKNNIIVFAMYFFITMIQYPVHYIYIPEYYGKVINTFKDNKESKLFYIVKMLLGLYCIELICSALVMITLYFIIPKFTEYATGSIFEFIIDHYENDFENISIGEILSKTIRMPNILFDYIDVIKNEFMKYFFVFLSGFVHYYSVSKESFLTYTTFIVLNYIYIFVMYTLFNKYELKANYLQDKMYETLVDCLNNLVTIYSFNQEQYEKDRFYNESFIDYKTNMYNTKGLYIKGDIIWSISNVCLFMIMNYFIYNSYKKGEITSEKLISTFVITFSIIGIFDNSERCAYNISRIHSQINDAEKFFNKISDVNANNKNVTNTFKNGDIVVKGVYHKYKDEFVLENINLTIHKGEKVAFVGQIGSGKSTLIKLIMGFQPLVMGDISIGGVQINNISNQELRSNIFYIPQKPKLFNRTLYENIVYGLKNPPSKNDILNILDDLKLEDLREEFKDRFDENMGIEGNKLSGGQRQIVWLLRAFFRKTCILILDEPTASLDPQNKNKLIYIIKRLTVGKTLIIVSHDEIDESFRQIKFKDGKLISTDFFKI